MSLLVRTTVLLAVTTVAATLVATASSAAKPLVPASIARDWVRWDKSSCSYKLVPRSQHAKTWTATIGQAPKGTLIGFGEQSESNPLTVAINGSMKKASAQAGADYFAVNYNWPDTAQPAIQAQALAQRKPTVAVSFNVIGATIPTVNKIYKDACIPVIQVTVPLKDAPTFGASNEDVGNLGAQFLIKYVKKQGWDPKTVTMLAPAVPSLGASINKRVTLCSDLFKQTYPAAGTSQLDMGASPVSGQQAVTDWLTAHPAQGQAQHVVACTIADIWANAVANALASQGRDKTAALIGNGASADGVKAVLSGGPIKASLWFDAGRYGNYMVPMALDVIAGKPVPLRVHQRLLLVTPANAAKFYR